MIGLFTGTGERVGFENAREGAKFSYKYRVRTDTELHAVEKNLQFAEFVGCEPADPVFALPPLGEVPEIVKSMRALRGYRPFGRDPGEEVARRVFRTSCFPSAHSFNYCRRQIGRGAWR